MKTLDSAEKRRELLDYYSSIRSRILTIDRIRIGYEKKKQIKIIHYNGKIDTFTGTEYAVDKFYREFRRTVLGIHI